MRPDIMITDELSAHDLSAVSRAIWSGVKVIASAHFAEIADVKPPFLGAFERYILLSSDKIGKIRGVYDEQLNELPLP
jgi:stage III sporulation protein SpoIIIAA